MHLTRIKTKDGKEYEGVLSPQRPLRKTLLADPPFAVLIVGLESIDILLSEIVSAITKGERVGIRKDEHNGHEIMIIKDVDELPAWWEFRRRWESGKEDWEV